MVNIYVRARRDHPQGYTSARSAGEENLFVDEHSDSKGGERDNDK